MTGKFWAILKAIVIIGLSTWINIWVINMIHFENLPVPRDWKIMIARAASALVSLVALWWLYPASMKRFTLRVKSQPLLISLGIVIFMVLPAFLRSEVFRATPFQFFYGIFFAMTIGVDEEIFSRGLIFSSMEGFGIQVAAVISSIHFGLLHLGNISWGGQSVSYTLTQVLTAGSFGYLAAGLMLFTRSIWIPILMHGLMDSPMQFETIQKYTQEVTGKGQWIPAIADALLNAMIGWVLISWTIPKRRAQIEALARRYDLLKD